MKVYTDSSFDSRNKIAGIGIYIDTEPKPYKIQNYIPSPDNNYGELWAIYIASILTQGKDCTIYTDSQTALTYINKQYKNKPRTMESYIRFQRLKLLAYKIRQLHPHIEWVKAHQCNFQSHALKNEEADLASRRGRAMFYER